MIRVLAVAACVVAIAPRVARAADEDATARARSHFEIGRGYFRLGNYSEALREFTAGYELAPRPQFLVNLGQCYRMLRDYDHARAMFEKFLAEAPADDPERAAVEQLLAELKGMSNPPTATAAVAPAPAPVIVAAAPPRPVEKKSFMQRHWWIIPVGAVVVIAGVAVGVYFGTRPGDACADAGGRCLRVMP